MRQCVRPVDCKSMAGVVQDVRDHGTSAFHVHQALLGLLLVRCHRHGHRHPGIAIVVTVIDVVIMIVVVVVVIVFAVVVIPA